MTFIQALLNSDNSYPTKKIDPLTHDFRAETLEDRLHSLYSFLCESDQYDITPKVKFILSEFRDELEFLKLANKPSWQNTSSKKVQNAWLQLVAKDRQRKLESVI